MRLLNNFKLELIRKNFNPAFKAAVFNNINIALEAFERFKKENEKFFSFDKKDPMLGYLRTYAIEKQFNDSAFNPNAVYTVSLKCVNKFNHKVMLIETNDFIYSLGRTNSENKLLPSSNYKKELSKLNYDIERQLVLENVETNSIFDTGKNYAEIIYGYKHNELTHLNIIIPNKDYKFIEYSENILNYFKVYNNYVPEELKEDAIVNLKKGILKTFEKKLDDD